MSDTPAQIGPPERCEFQHKVFSTLGTVRFRRSATDGIAMMAVKLGEREAMLPLDSLKREFAIDDDSADARMLDLIGNALNFVTCLAPGDTLPPEVCTGDASWKPSADHVLIATTRLQLDLVTWQAPASQRAKAGREVMTLLRLAEDPAWQEEVHLAAGIAATQIGLPDAAALLCLMAQLAQELSFIEALRERLQDRVVRLCRRLSRLLQEQQRSPGSFDTMSQVHRLASAAAKQIVNRFEDVDAQTGEIGSLLRNVENQRSFIRSNRDWLYRTQRAWEPVLDRWVRSAALPVHEMGALLNLTYHFLAQRSLPGTAWQRPLTTRANHASPALAR